jgi:HemK-related putative methylase
LIENDYEDVYFPSDDSYLIIDYFNETLKSDQLGEKPLSSAYNILDLGTGTGIIAIFLALMKKKNSKFKASIYASDILDHSIECAKHNAKLNSVQDKITFIRSDLFKDFNNDFSRSFDTIIFNPPYLPSINESEGNTTNLDTCWDGGKDGCEILSRFFGQVKPYLNLEHHPLIYYLISTASNVKRLKQVLYSSGFTTIELRKIHFFFEDIILNKAEII